MTNETCMAARCNKSAMPDSTLCKEHYDALPAPMRGEQPTSKEPSTPKTDAAIWYAEEDSIPRIPVVDADFARQLERELSQSRESCLLMKKAAQNACSAHEPEPKPRIVYRTHYPTGLTVQNLREIVKDWPDLNHEDEPTEVWISRPGNCSNQVRYLSPLTLRTNDAGEQTADILLSADYDLEPDTPAPPPSADATDAARYRWLRNHIAPSALERITSTPKSLIADKRPEALDVEIDLRMAGKTGTGAGPTKPDARPKVSQADVNAFFDPDGDGNPRND